MPNTWFRFKQFTVHQDRCAMKVGTDGMLLGAWAVRDGKGAVLDIGTGTGLLALIAAQRMPDAEVHAVEVDPAAAGQAAGNAAASPWAARIFVHAADIRHWRSPLRYKLILCNPPFYSGHQASEDQRMAAAKHDGSLRLAELFQAMARLIDKQGRACLILPADRWEESLRCAGEHGLSAVRQCAVRYRPGKPVKRVLVEFSLNTVSAAEADELVLHETDGTFTPSFRALISDLELHA